MISVSSIFAPSPTVPPTQLRLWHFERTQHENLRNFLFDFPWDDYCTWSRNPDQVALKVAVIMTVGMEAYIPSSTKTFSPLKHWFDRACSMAIPARNRSHQSYQVSPSDLTRSAFIIARNRCTAQIQRSKASFIRRNYRESFVVGDDISKAFDKVWHKALSLFERSSGSLIVR
ncbi:hypothetical protein SK128_015750 [Halocaridina rubra]|uniref:Uncharacterized protein n=1 Tax=Halocaridina rubra TaxID=373956 RepID=A0AAN9A6H1_HALRR